MKAGNKRPGLRLRVVLEPGLALGPGKADILEGIAETGSIAAAGRRMGMSYKRVWYLVETLNRSFPSPLVVATKGGAGGGGAALTPLGAKVLARYRRMETAASRAAGPEVAALRRLLKG